MPKVLKIYMQPAFLICAAVLAAAGVSMPVAIEKFGVYLQKEPLPLKKPLDFLDEKGLGSYRVLSKEKIDNPEVVKSLGTKDYIQWTLEDTEAVADSPVRQCSLFVTYYELPDRVPHVPEECYIGSGFQKLSGDNLTVTVGSGGNSREIPVKYLVFTSKNQSNWRRDTQFSVLYLFKVNGDFANSRESARIALNKNIRYKHSYFSKVEWKFFNMSHGVTVNPTKSEAISASERLLGVILPVLESGHWPEWTR